MESTTSASSSELPSKRYVTAQSTCLSRICSGEHVNGWAVILVSVDRQAKFLAKLCVTVLFLGEKGY